MKDWEKKFNEKFPYLKYDEDFDSSRSKDFGKCFHYKRSGVKRFISNLLSYKGDR